MKKKVLSAALVLGVCSGVSAMEKNRLAEHVPGEVLVKIKPGMLKSFLSNKSLYDAEIKEEIHAAMGELVLLRVPQTKSLNTIISDINKNAAVEYAEPNFIYRAIDTVQNATSIINNLKINKDVYTAMTPNDPRYGKLWGLRNTGDNEPAGSRGNSSATGKAGADVNAESAWAMSKGSHQVKIAVIDTGVDYNHEDLRNNMWTNTAEANGRPGVDDDGNGYVDDIHGYDFANNDGDPMDGNSHGTHCAGTIAAEHNNGIGIAGVMAQASIVGVKFLTDQGSGTTADAIKAVDYATKVNVDIMSNSWGGGGASQALEDAIKRAKNAGIVFTAAAGNSATDNNSTPHYPSNYDVDNVISVAAHNYNDGLASFSCYGSRTVHVAAPGRNILSTTPNNEYAVYSGTSMATPHVTGVIGLYIAQNGRSDVKELRDNLMASSVYARAYGRKTIAGGRVDAHNFLNGIVTPRPARPNPNAWISSSNETFESQHPYGNSVKISKTISVPGAKFMRIVVKKYELENNYDFLTIKNSAGEAVEKVSGAGENYVSEYVEGDSITIEFTSDSSVNKWGFNIEEYQYIQ
jgi:thermitase